MYTQIRNEFLKFFTDRNHKLLPSSSLVPHGDDTLLFTNSGMVQFKNVFCGLENPPSSNATTAQKCVRAGGKHNDLDQVGYSRRHHTFFEMLGNFSFGSYFKEQAIKYAWDFVTNVLQVNKDRLYISIYASDNEALDLWLALGIPKNRIMHISTNDNFWSMGDTGPCGPCSEIYYSHTATPPTKSDGTIDFDHQDIVEIWNLVFMQNEQTINGMQKLNKQCIDTGMGLERIVSVLEGVKDNYHTTLFKTISSFIQDTYNSKNNDQVIHRIVSDHIRATVFLIADGVLPSNEGRGYVLRRIMRRAMKNLNELNPHETKMHTLLTIIDQEMGDAYPEIRKHHSLISNTILQEESNFRDQLGRGMHLLCNAIDDMGSNDILPGHIAFKLYDTYGFPVDITIDQLKKHGKTLDQDGFDIEMQAQRNRNISKTTKHHDPKIWFDIKGLIQQTKFIGYDTFIVSDVILYLLNENLEHITTIDQSGWIITRNSVFYPEGGGQEGDNGTITTNTGIAVISQTKKFADTVIGHYVSNISGTISKEQIATLEIDIQSRNNRSKHHSATHLLHRALKDILGENTMQRGSFVGADNLRFDFNYSGSITKSMILAIEDHVNHAIIQGSPVLSKITSKDESEKMGAMMIFGEKYGDTVRVISMNKSIECCGGTHVNNISEIGIFKIINLQGIGAGLKRISAIVGTRAYRYLQGQDLLLSQIHDESRCNINTSQVILDAIDHHFSTNMLSPEQYDDINSRIDTNNQIKWHMKKTANEIKNAILLANQSNSSLVKQQLIDPICRYMKRNVYFATAENLDYSLLRNIIKAQKKDQQDAIIVISLSYGIMISDNVESESSLISVLRKSINGHEKRYDNDHITMFTTKESLDIDTIRNMIIKCSE